MNWPQCTAREFAELCGVTGQTVTNWLDEGMPCISRGGSGKKTMIDPGKAVPWALARRAPPGSERERLARVQADKVELENAKRRGELVEMSYVGQWSMELVTGLNGELDGLPGRCAAEVAGMNAAEARARLLDETRAIRRSLAKRIEQLADTPPAVEAAGEDGDAAPAPKRKRVGGRKPGTATRKRRARTVAK